MGIAESFTTGYMIHVVVGVPTFLMFTFLSVRHIKLYTGEGTVASDVPLKQRKILLYTGLFLLFIGNILVALATYTAQQHMYLNTLNNATTQQYRQLRKLDILVALGLAWDIFGIILCSPKQQQKKTSHVQ